MEELRFRKADGSKFGMSQVCNFSGAERFWESHFKRWTGYDKKANFNLYLDLI